VLTRKLNLYFKSWLFFVTINTVYILDLLSIAHPFSLSNYFLWSLFSCVYGIGFSEIVNQIWRVGIPADLHTTVLNLGYVTMLLNIFRIFRRKDTA
jgi:hypothetical protein